MLNIKKKKKYGNGTFIRVIDVFNCGIRKFVLNKFIYPIIFFSVITKKIAFMMCLL